MSYPSDYRYLPFSDTTNYVSKTEYHQIPATSPFEVRLNEVPEKASPSTMTIKVVTGWSGGSPVYGATMTEVSATPASGEYYPDYYTEADGDSNWNTGTIQFNSANANTTIEVTYMATGGLASIKSNHYPSWMTDRGDGSDGVFAPTSNTTIAGGVKNYTSVNIPAGVTVTCTDSTCIKCQGGFTNNGTIVVTPNGGAGGPRGLGEDSAVEPRAGGAGGDGYGWGGQGGAGGTGRGTRGGAGGDFYSSSDFLRFGGSGGGGGGGGYEAGTFSGNGGRGGGAIFITATNFINNGIIQANGEAGVASTYKHTGGGGGGGGGCIGIFAIQIQQGTLTANGGAGGTTPAGGNGTAGVNGTNGTIKVVEV